MRKERRGGKSNKEDGSTRRKENGGIKSNEESGKQDGRIVDHLGLVFTEA